MGASDEYSATQKRLIQWAIRDVNNLVDSVDMDDPDAARDALAEELPTLITVWGEIAATAAAEYFEDLIGSPASLAEPAAGEALQTMVRWAVGPLYGSLETVFGEDDQPVLDEAGNPVQIKIPPDPAKARRNLLGASQRHILDQGRNTVRQAAASTPGVAWARVLQGETSCAFCVVLAGRGAVYESESTARSETLRKDTVGGMSEAYHDYCDCLVIAIRNESDWPEGYDHEKYELMYYEARQKAGNNPQLGYKTLRGGTPGRPRALRDPDEPLSILQAMRELYDMR
jgi:hypothetical protein